MFEKNRRKYPRVNYPCQLTMWASGGIYDTVLAQTADIGLGGLCVHLNQAIAQGTKIDIQIDFTDGSPIFRCQGVVVRCQQDNKKEYNIGVQFEPLSEPNHALLEAKIAQLIKRENKGNPS